VNLGDSVPISYYTSTHYFSRSIQEMNNFRLAGAFLIMLQFAVITHEAEEAAREVSTYYPRPIVQA
jgi:hypothetical protein